MNYQWRVLDHRIVFQGYFRIEKYRIEHELYEGGWSQPFDREVFERGSAVAVLPYDPHNDRVILIEQFRAGAIGATGRPWLKEIVAGIIEPQESLESVARRECIEEAGCEILELERICRYFASPGGSTEQCTIFYGRIDSHGIGGVHGLDEEQEDIRVEVVDFDQAMAWLDDGTIDSAVGIIALQWLRLNRERLRAGAGL
jgi:ADP-ribose pyrophosphatase